MTDPLRAELDRWADLGRPATFWWRDDDAVAPTPALDRLLALADRHRVAIGLAVVPADALPDLGRRLEHTGTVVLQHGWTHRNHAPATEKKAEFGAHRPVAEAAADLAVGRARLFALFGDDVLPVLVPPWNRIVAALVDHLPQLGFIGISTAKPRRPDQVRPGLTVANSHVDPIDWRHGKRCLGADAVRTMLADHLAARRRNLADPDEPTCLLTHHLVHDDAMWDCLGTIAAEIGDHRAARWLTPRAVFQFDDRA